ncbi:hypothetical protein EVAR_6758_1 [Eumeta japonica]|uniref:Uncharacterized protein n=1 Tax=Eumeta variegata TaxID=151549 RepID=A0A4C1V4H5_EUMVA|nr:hypothetical protein EVAR_6758_1 [Eumeta japonica]
MVPLSILICQSTAYTPQCSRIHTAQQSAFDQNYDCVKRISPVGKSCNIAAGKSESHFVELSLWDEFVPHLRRARPSRGSSARLESMENILQLSIWLNQLACVRRRRPARLTAVEYAASGMRASSARE